MQCRVGDLRMIGGWAKLDLPSTETVRPRSTGSRRHLHLIRAGGDGFWWLPAAAGGIRFWRIGGAEGPRVSNVILLLLGSCLQNTYCLYLFRMYLYLYLYGILNINTGMF
ncbi:hypothetical protein PAHAL_5G493000 [Panicum hallii]|uniref:Uncharacterized protein n=1 Tax=Panicum hallii TaxID=206008 RepID=A0A2S3HYW4_9POAL|nr:hypothetical protein PAHAL_5G493000 [Panicum hallii]